MLGHKSLSRRAVLLAAGFVALRGQLGEARGDEGLAYVETTLQARTGQYAKNIGTLQTGGYRVVGDGGGGTWRRSDRPDGSSFTDATGQAWVLSDPVVSPKQVGGFGDGRSDDTSAIQAVVDLCRPVDLGGQENVWLLIANQDSPFTYGNTLSPCHFAVSIPRPGLRLSGSGATVRFRGYRPADVIEVNYAFLARKTADENALGPVAVDGLRFEFDGSGVGRNLRSFHIVGSKDVKISNCSFQGLPKRAGSTITLQNCSNIHMYNLSFKDVTQGMNFSYVNNVVVDNIIFDNFVEAIDFDRVAINVNISNVFFKNGGQCLDFSSIEDVSVSAVSAEKVGNIVKLNYKPTTPPTYEEYLAGVMKPGRPTVGGRILIRNVRGVEAGSGRFPAFDIGFSRSGPYGNWPAVPEIKLIDVRLTKSGWTRIREGVGISLEDWRLTDVTGTDSRFGAAIHASGSDPKGPGALSIALRNIVVEGVEGDAILVERPASLSVEGLHVSRFGAGRPNSAGLRVIGGAQAGFQIKPNAVVGSGVPEEQASLVVVE
ncbi:right-handed parallel beta-helix repeat-containing protein [Aquabacter cavernae]|uniref:right-handed parallel beta-helix repeat-containing protein n=1 Tax=Aquabacter cavernae TaxID=2496029 RepID=UPI000F8F3769|nr:right-handed parallel beta-helix repeat-containing protein [Aquabacter cavernae]